MNRLNALDWVALVLVIIGAINWGLIGLFAVNVVGAIFGDMTWISRLIYILVGLAGVYVAVVTPRIGRRPTGTDATGPG